MRETTNAELLYDIRVLITTDETIINSDSESNTPHNGAKIHLDDTNLEDLKGKIMRATSELESIKQSLSNLKKTIESS